MTDPIIEVARSFSQKINLGNYTSADHFCSAKTSCNLSEGELMAKKLYLFCKKAVAQSVAEYRANGLSDPEPPPTGPTLTEELEKLVGVDGDGNELPPAPLPNCGPHTPGTKAAAEFVRDQKLAKIMEHAVTELRVDNDPNGPSTPESEGIEFAQRSSEIDGSSASEPAGTNGDTQGASLVKSSDQEKSNVGQEGQAELAQQVSVSIDEPAGINGVNYGVKEKLGTTPKKRGRPPGSTRKGQIETYAPTIAPRAPESQERPSELTSVAELISEEDLKILAEDEPFVHTAHPDGEIPVVPPKSQQERLHEIALDIAGEWNRVIEFAKDKMKSYILSRLGLTILPVFPDPRYEGLIEELQNIVNNRQILMNELLKDPRKLAGETNATMNFAHEEFNK
jgi:hypothetical protein